MRDETREEIVRHAARWSSIILNEALANHGGSIPPQARDKLRRALELLTEAQFEIRFPDSGDQ